MITLNLTAATEAKLSALAAMNGQTIEETASEMIQFGLLDAEPSREFRPNAETLEAFAEIERGEGETMTLEEFLQWMKDVKDEVDQETKTQINGSHNNA